MYALWDGSPLRWHMLQAPVQLSYPLDLIVLDRHSREPLHRQLCDQVRGLILSDAIRPGARLPSTRTIAGELRISRNTVIVALDQLAAEGLLESRRGAGMWVGGSARTAPRPTAVGVAPTCPPLSARGEQMLSQPRTGFGPAHQAFNPGTPELRRFPFARWSKLLTRRARVGGQDLFGYHNVRGHPELCSAIAGFLNTARGVRCLPEQILVTTGGQAALDLLARLLLVEGDVVWMEEPGYIGARSAFLSAGARLVAMPVEASGWRLPQAPAPRPRVIYLTPSCHHPLGVSMTLDQRSSVIEAAAAANAWLIEDDFDGEYTFEERPLPAIQGLTDEGRVIYVGTFAKTLFPAMRLGFIVLPGDLAKRVEPALAFTGQFPPLLLQASLADFIGEGHFFLHLNRMRRLYAERRAHFLKMFRRHLGEWLEPVDGRTGIQIASLFRSEADDRRLADIARLRGVNLAPLSLYYVGKPRCPGFLLGYAGVSESEADSGLLVLRDVLRENPELTGRTR